MVSLVASVVAAVDAGALLRLFLCKWKLQQTVLLFFAESWKRGAGAGARARTRCCWRPLCRLDLTHATSFSSLSDLIIYLHQLLTATTKTI